MNKPIGISFEVGKDEQGWFWYLGKQKFTYIRPTRYKKDAKYGGFKIDLSFGTMKRPVGKMYKWGFWRYERKYNAWNSGNYWFMLHIPWCPGAFISLCYGDGKKQPGFYLGMKTYKVDHISQDWMDPNTGLRQLGRFAWGSEEDRGNIYLCLSGSVRDDLIDG